MHETTQPAAIRAAPSLGATVLLTLAWYSLMKGWVLCASFSCDRYRFVT